MNAGQPSFVVRVIDEADVGSKIDGFKPTSGMPADVYIKTGERTFFAYLMRPVPAEREGWLHDGAGVYQRISPPPIDRRGAERRHLQAITQQAYYCAADVRC